MEMISGKPKVTESEDVINETRPTVLWGKLVYEPEIVYDGHIKTARFYMMMDKERKKGKDPRFANRVECYANEKTQGGMPLKVIEQMIPGDYVVAFGVLVTNGFKKKNVVKTTFRVDAIYPMSMMVRLSEMMSGGMEEDRKPDPMEYEP